MFLWLWICSLCVVIATAQRQNQPPIFLPGGDMNGFALSEDTPKGSSVYTLRGQDPEGTDVTYSISGDYLSVGRNSGVVSLVKPLDREKVSSIETIITVTDGRIFGQEPHTVPLRLDIPILDVNDNRPTFREAPYSFTVSEGASPGATLFSDVSIVDLDAGRHSEITLSCMTEQSPDACLKFQVREAKVGNGNYIGVISLISPLDYEKNSKYTLKVKAEDGGGLSSTTSIDISVSDIQDQPPSMLNAPYSASVPEGSKAGVKILDILARDGDLGKPQPIKLSIEEDDKGYFALSNVQQKDDGIVSATLVASDVPLDREDSTIAQNGGIYFFYIKVEELGGRKESTRSKVVIVVSDTDDQRAVFSANEAAVTVSENIADGTPLPDLDLIVSDGDIRDNARFTLALEDALNTKGINEIFEVSPKEGVGRTPVIIKVKNGSALDFENPLANYFALKVVAKQRGQTVSSALVQVRVKDANDNSPIFTFPTYRFSIAEDAEPNFPIAVLVANDSDSGDFGKLMYSMKGFGAEKFFVNSSTGQISVTNCGTQREPCLDYEVQRLFSLTYSAADGGSRVTSVNVFIKVLDVNDNPPSFEMVEYRRVVDEGTTYFDPPMFVKASDIDGKDQGAGIVTYAIKDGNTEDEAFEVDSVTGEITIRRPLTHIDTPSSIYALTIRATDAGTPQLHSDVRVLVTVGRDKNRPPRFMKQIYYSRIMENALPGTEVITVKARDPDGSDGAITYHFGSGGADNFELDPKTGAIVVAHGAILDRDVDGSFQLVVTAVDGGKETQQSTNALVSVTLTDINNKPPIFDQKSYIGHVNERSTMGEIILTVVASDPDLNPRLSFSVTKPIFAFDKTGVKLHRGSAYDYENAFGVNQTTGEIYISGALDHNAAAVIVFSVITTDENADKNFPLQNDTAEVTIYVQVFSDINPIFASPWTPSRPFLRMTLKEEEPVGHKLFSVAAKDPVSGRLVRRYEKIIGSDPNDIFAVDPISGQVSLKKRLDYEALENKEVSFDVMAIAGDRTSSATAIVKVEDINDHNPRFVEGEYHARLEEDAIWPKTVLQVVATDDDMGENGEILYELGGADKVLFVINATTGVIQVARGATLDRESTPIVNLEVSALDNPKPGANRRRSSVSIKIELVDVNDEEPKWSDDGQYTAVVPENTPVGAVVSQVTATDTDLGVNGVVTYEIPELQHLEGLFEIDADSGIIKVKSPLSGKGRTAPYELTVRALDKGTPPQFSEAHVSLFIGDVSLNDGVPVFIKPSANEIARVMENSPKGTAVFQVQAVDADNSDTPNGKIIYSFLQTREKNKFFHINSNTGLITTRGKLDREMIPQHHVVVVAQDMGRLPQITSRILMINITDADDNDPAFTKLPGKEYLELEVEEEAASETTVGFVKAFDNDIGENSLIDYKITYGNDGNLFGIKRTENNEGEIFVKGRIDREKIAEIKLVVACGKLDQRLPDRLTYESSDPSLLQVIIKVKDLDDNRPQFEKSEYTGGVKVDAPLLTRVLKLTAVDQDPTAMPVRYTLFNASIARLLDNQKLGSVSVINGSEAFLLEEASGVIRTSAPFALYNGDVFILFVSASSNPRDKPVLTKVMVYVLRNSEMLRFVFAKNPREVRSQIPDFLSQVERALPVSADLNVYDTRYYDDAKGNVDYEKTGSCFQLVGRNIEDTRKLLDAKKNEKLKEVFEAFQVDGVEPCQPRRLSGQIDWVEIWVLVIAAFIGLGSFLASCAVCCLYSCYKSRIKKNLQHIRLLESPKLIGEVPPQMHPGSIVMLPPPHPGLMGQEMLQVPPGMEWQEMGGPLDNISYGSVRR